MMKLAVDGGTPVFNGKKASEFAPSWPIAYPETEEHLLSVFRSGKWGGYGLYEQRLMTDFAAWQGAKYSAWMANGTVTLECALISLGVGPGDEVIVPGVSWIATAEAPIYAGATPVIVDIDPDTLCIDPARIEEAITPRTKAIIPVHLFSAVCDMEKIMAIAKKHNLFVIEDCAHSHGARQHGIGTGSFGEYGSFSFQLSKLMTAGEGGCCTTNDLELLDRVFRASHIGNSKIHPNEMPETGFICHQYRFTEFQAAVIWVQLKHQDELKARRAESMKQIELAIKDTPGVKTQKSSYDDDERVYYFPTIMIDPERLKPGISRESVIAALEAEGVSMNIGWGFPLCRMGAWNVPENLYIKKETPICDDVMLRQVLVCGNNILLAGPDVAVRVGEAIDKVMRAYTC